MTIRAILCGIWHETNTFAPHPTTLDQFEVLRGEEIVDGYAGTRTAPGAFLTEGAALGWQVVPVFTAGATPSGIVTGEAFGVLASELCERVAAARPFDALLVSLHGAMAAW